MIKPHSLVIRSALCFLALPSVFLTSNVLSRSRPNFLSSQDLPASSLNRGVCFTQCSSWLRCFSLFHPRPVGSSSSPPACPPSSLQQNLNLSLPHSHTGPHLLSKHSSPRRPVSSPPSILLSEQSPCSSTHLLFPLQNRLCKPVQSSSTILRTR
uniref:Uncharacterized protein n=1 Tax=Nothobranchius furzeri TaxID=105023 RepID=A0A1A8BBM3_NOTFU